jgi:hypothetical protein
MNNANLFSFMDDSRKRHSIIIVVGIYPIVRILAYLSLRGDTYISSVMSRQFILQIYSPFMSSETLIFGIQFVHNHKRLVFSQNLNDSVDENRKRATNEFAYKIHGWLLKKELVTLP